MLAIVLVLVAVSVVGTMGGAIWSTSRQRRRLHALPRTRIAELVGGRRVRIVGTARSLGQDVGAAFSGTVCLACHCWMGTSGDGDTPDPVDRVAPFRVEDDTGSIAVEVEHVTLELTGHLVELSSAPVFGASIIRREAGTLAGGSVDCWEDRLDLDGRVAVIGYVVRGDDGNLRLTGRAQDPLVIANVAAAFEG